MVASTLSLVCQSDEKCSDGCQGVALRLKASKLGMMAVTLGSAAKDFLREQSLPPSGDQSFRVKVSWMNGP